MAVDGFRFSGSHQLSVEGSPKTNPAYYVQPDWVYQSSLEVCWWYHAASSCVYSSGPTLSLSLSHHASVPGQRVQLHTCPQAPGRVPHVVLEVALQHPQHSSVPGHHLGRQSPLLPLLHRDEVALLEGRVHVPHKNGGLLLIPRRTNGISITVDQLLAV